MFKDKELEKFINSHFKINVNDLVIDTIITNFIGVKTIIYKLGNDNYLLYLFPNGDIENFMKIVESENYFHFAILNNDDSVRMWYKTICSILIIKNEAIFIEDGENKKSIKIKNKKLSDEERTKIIMLGELD